MPWSRGEKTRWLGLALVVQVLAVVVWLWPIGVGGRMPVGGDVTQFSIGLMAVLGRSLRAGRLPLWNDLWGYGFPGVGESQMGVFYPPHWILYGLLPLEAGYTASLVLHTLWGGLGAFWAARRLGVSPWGALVSGFSWSTCGFFLIHLSHQWSYTTGSWMPWAWGLAWVVLRGESRGREAFWLAVVLTLQLLPGHFQLAFCTQIGVALMALEQAVERRWSRMGGYRSIGKVIAALIWAFPMAAAQLWPTLRLARLAAPRRDFEYLSGFAATPFHLVSLLAPGLFERSPLWRPIVWDPFHTSPEEYLGYVGLVPLFLALGALGAGWKRSAAVRALGAVGLVTLLLGLGPYVPGFRYGCQLPGFSFFRAPARWMLASSLALSLLAGIGFDGLPGWLNVRRAILRFVAGGVLVVALVVLGVELGVVCVDRSTWPALADLYARVLDMLPWGETAVYRRIATEAWRPNTDFRVQEALAREGVRLADAPRPVFAERRFAIYREELAGTVLLMAGLLALAGFSRRPRWVQVGLVALTLLDLEALGSHRRVDLGPIAALTGQSPVLAEMARQGRGTRSVDSLRNLPMVAGSGPVSAYRTLDLPAVEALTVLAGSLPANPSESMLVAQVARLTGASIRVYEPAEVVALTRPGQGWPGEERGQFVDDPALAGWRFGVDWVAQSGPRAARFRVSELRGGGVQAWLVPLTPSRSGAILGTWSGQALDILAALRGAEPLDLRRGEPGSATLSLHCDGPALVMITQLADPQWEAAWSGPGGERSAAIRPAFGRPGQGAWQAVAVPGAGDWTLRVNYHGRDVGTGLIVSALAVSALAVVLVRSRGPASTRTEGERR